MSTPGGLDDEGVYQYGEGDAIGATWSDYMNLGQESVSDAIKALRLATTLPPVQNAILPSSPWAASGSLALPALAKKNGMIHLTSGAVIRTTAMTANAGTQYQFATVPSGLVSSGDWLPSTEVYGIGVAFANSGTPVPVYISILPTGAVVMVPASTITFGAGGATNSVRVPTISWTEP